MANNRRRRTRDENAERLARLAGANIGGALATISKAAGGALNFAPATIAFTVMTVGNAVGYLAESDVLEGVGHGLAATGTEGMTAAGIAAIQTKQLRA